MNVPTQCNHGVPFSKEYDCTECDAIWKECTMSNDERLLKLSFEHLGQEYEKLKAELTASDAALKESRANDMESMRQLAELKEKSEWISVEDKLPKCDMKDNSFGVAVLIYPPYKEDGVSEMTQVFYGCRQTKKPNFYIFGRVVNDVTHWQPIPDAPK